LRRKGKRDVESAKDRQPPETGQNFSIGIKEEDKKAERFQSAPVKVLGEITGRVEKVVLGAGK